MAEQIDVRLEEMKALLDHLHQVTPALSQLGTYLREQVCCAEGFQGLMHELVDPLKEVAAAGTQLEDLAFDRWSALIDAVRRTAREMDMADGQSSGLFDKTLHRVPGTVAPRAV